MTALRDLVLAVAVARRLSSEEVSLGSPVEVHVRGEEFLDGGEAAEFVALGVDIRVTQLLVEETHGELRVLQHQLAVVVQQEVHLPDLGV